MDKESLLKQINATTASLKLLQEQLEQVTEKEEQDKVLNFLSSVQKVFLPANFEDSPRLRSVFIDGDNVSLVPKEIDKLLSGGFIHPKIEVVNFTRPQLDFGMKTILIEGQTWNVFMTAALGMVFIDPDGEVFTPHCQVSRLIRHNDVLL